MVLSNGNEGFLDGDCKIEKCRNVLQAVEIAFKLAIKSICISYRDFLGSSMIKVIRKFRITEDLLSFPVLYGACSDINFFIGKNWNRYCKAFVVLL